MQMALVDEPGGRRRGGDRLARLQQPPRLAHTVGDLQRMGRKSGPLAHEPDEPELPDPGDGGELLQADVALRMLGQVVARRANRGVVAAAQRRTLPAYR